METNELPKINMDKSETGCCPKFDPEGWDGQTIVFDNKLFAKATTCSFLHIPLNMTSMYMRVCKKIEDEKASENSFLVLSHDPSPWKGEHFFAVDKDLPGEEMVRLSGTFLTKVFEGPYKNAGKWYKDMGKYVEEQGKKMKKFYCFYTTCPKCCKHYGKNYVIAFAEVE